MGSRDFNDMLVEQGEEAIRAVPAEEISAVAPRPGTNQEFELRLASEPRNDIGNAHRLIARFGVDLAWVPDWGWLVWNGAHWERDMDAHAVLLRMQQTAAAIRFEADALEKAGALPGEDVDAFTARVDSHRKWGVSSGNSGRLSGAIDCAAPRLTRKAEEFDAA